MYDTIVLGATFASAGIARELKENCLVIEPRVQAGYEFIGALCPEPVDESNLYACFSQCRILFSTQIVSVEKTEEGFLCVTHGPNGFDTHRAKRVVDTRCTPEMCHSKTFNLLIDSRIAPAFPHTQSRKVSGEGRYLLLCEVPLSCSYPEARTVARQTIENFTPEQRLILSANEFDYQVRKDFPKTENGIVYLPSKACQAPNLALAAGAALGKEWL